MNFHNLIELMDYFKTEQDCIKYLYEIDCERPDEKINSLFKTKYVVLLFPLVFEVSQYSMKAKLDKSVLGTA